MQRTPQIASQIWIAGLMTAFVVVNTLTAGLSAAPRPDEERYFDREDIQNVASWLALLHPADTQYVRSSSLNLCPCAGQSGSAMSGGGNSVGGATNYAAISGSGSGSGSGSSSMLGAMNKRNSELINSLLSLPKAMNNAGK